MIMEHKENGRYPETDIKMSEFFSKMIYYCLMKMFYNLRRSRDVVLMLRPETNKNHPHINPRQNLLLPSFLLNLKSLSPQRCKNSY